MNLLIALWAKWQTSRLFCDYCGLVPVDHPHGFCSDECTDWAILEDKAA